MHKPSDGKILQPCPFPPPTYPFPLTHFPSTLSSPLLPFPVTRLLLNPPIIPPHQYYHIYIYIRYISYIHVDYKYIFTTITVKISKILTLEKKSYKINKENNNNVSQQKKLLKHSFKKKTTKNHSNNKHQTPTAKLFQSPSCVRTIIVSKIHLSGGNCSPRNQKSVIHLAILG